VTRAEGRFSKVEHRKKASRANRSATEIADNCVTTVRASIEHAIIRLRSANAPWTKFEALFAGLFDIVTDLQRQNLGTDYEPRLAKRQGDQISPAL
jgi:hypothetical protein